MHTIPMATRHADAAMGKHRRARRPTSAAVALAVIIVWWAAGAPVYAGAVAYPALGHVELEEGTIELWLTPTTELYPDLEEGGFRRAFSLFSLDVSEHFAFSGMWASRGTSHGPHVSMSSRRQQRGLIPVPGRAVDWWEPGEPAHVALTWRGREMTMIVDGERVSRRHQGVGFSGELVDVMLVIGDARSRDNDVVMHAVRVSNVARDAESLAEAEPEADLATLLLDRFERIETDDDGTWSVPAVSSSLVRKGGDEAESGLAPVRGELRGAWHQTDEPRPGLALHPEP